MNDARDLVGQPLDALDTPALLVDLDAMEANIDRLATFFRQHGVGWRPHCKSHKCPAIARRQLAAGAIGITCAKVSEAEMLVAAGIGPLLIANEVVTPRKLGRLAALQRCTEVMAAIDNAHVLPAMATAATEAGAVLPVLIEVDLGMNRVGVAPGAAVLDLARQVATTPGVRLRGVMGYEGHVISAKPRETKVQACREALDRLLDAAARLRANGLAADVVSAGGTGCYDITGAQPGITEVQAGGGIFMDGMYRDQCGVDTLSCGLTVLATVTSRTDRHVVLDAGFKTLSAYHHPPTPRHRDDLKLRYLSAEHGVFDLLHGPGPAIAEQVELLVGYSDSTNFLHDWLLGVRQGRVEEVFPVQGRGLLT